MGFLEIKPRIGTYVTDYRRKGNIETREAVMKYNRGRIRSDEIRAILEIRDALDKLAVCGIVDRLTESESMELREKAMQICTACNNEDAAKAAFEFQHELAILSGNTLLPLIFRSFYDLIILLWERFCMLHGKERLYRVSFTLWEYIDHRDAQGAMQWIEACTKEVIQGDVQIFF